MLSRWNRSRYLVTLVALFVLASGVAAVLFALGTHSRPGPTDATAGIEPMGGPQIELEQLIHILGEFDAYETTACTIGFRNTGPEDLEVRRIAADCPSCISIRDWTRVVPPGESGFVKLDVDFGKRQEFTQPVRLYTNATNVTRGTATVSLVADLRQWLWIEPRGGIDLGAIRQGSPIPPSTVYLRWNREADFHVADPANPRPGLLDIETRPYDDASHRGLDLIVSFRDTETILAENGSGTLLFEIDLPTDHEGVGSIPLRWELEVVEDLVVRPRRLDLRRSSLRLGDMTSVRVAVAPDRRLTIRDVSCTVPCFDVSVRALEGETLYEVGLTVISSVPELDSTGVLVLSTDFPRVPRVVVPIEIRD